MDAALAGGEAGGADGEVVVVVVSGAGAGGWVGEGAAFDFEVGFLVGGEGVSCGWFFLRGGRGRGGDERLRGRRSFGR